MLCEAFGEQSLSWTAVSAWHSCFKVGRVSAEDDDRSGRPSTSKTTKNVAKIRELIHEYRRQTLHELADTGGISYGVCQILIENLNMRCIAAKSVPQPLTNDQNQGRVNVSLELCENANEDPTFISRIIMGDESWSYGYDPETMQQSSQWKSPQSPTATNARQVQSSTKSMLIVFLCEGDCSL
jgi:hypothetical protein